MSIHRRAARRDSNEPEIIEALEKAGVVVVPLSGGGVPDLACYTFRDGTGQWRMLEVKNKEWYGKLTNDQDWDETIESGAVTVVWNVEDALRACGLIN